MNIIYLKADVYSPEMSLCVYVDEINVVSFWKINLIITVTIIVERFSSNAKWIIVEISVEKYCEFSMLACCHAIILRTIQVKSSQISAIKPSCVSGL